MAVSRTSAEFAGRINAGAVKIAGANRAATSAAAFAAKQVFLDAAKSDSGGDQRLSRWGKNGVKLNVGYDVDTTAPTVSTAEVEPRPLGPWRVLNDGAGPHPIVPGASRQVKRAGRDRRDHGMAGPLSASVFASGRSKRTSARVLSIGDGWVAAWVEHPGSRPKRTWSRSVPAAKAAAAGAYQKAQSKAVRAAFGK